MAELYKELPNLLIELKPNFVLPRPVFPQHYQLTPYRVDEALSDACLMQFVKLGLFFDIRQVQIFTSPRNYVGDIHIDGTDPNTQEGAINWVYDETPESNWSTEWYCPKESSRPTNIDSGPGSALYFKSDNFEIIESWNGPCSVPTLVHVGVPHRIVNRSNRVRYCISIRFNEKHNFQTLKSLLITD
jgi:hypothetical protein